MCKANSHVEWKTKYEITTGASRRQSRRTSWQLVKAVVFLDEWSLPTSSAQSLADICTLPHGGSRLQMFRRHRRWVPVSGISEERWRSGRDAEWTELIVLKRSEHGRRHAGVFAKHGSKWGGDVAAEELHEKSERYLESPVAGSWIVWQPEDFCALHPPLRFLLPSRIRHLRLLHVDLVYRIKNGMQANGKTRIPARSDRRNWDCSLDTACETLCVAHTGELKEGKILPDRATVQRAMDHNCPRKTACSGGNFTVTPNWSVGSSRR